MTQTSVTHAEMAKVRWSTVEVHRRAEEPDIVLQAPFGLRQAAQHDREQRIADHRDEQDERRQP